MNVGFYRIDLVIIYIVFVLVLLYGILRPRQKREWRSAGITGAWAIALYSEMYGFPLTLYVLSNIFGPHLSPQEFQNGHVWAPLFGLGDHWNLAFTIAGQTFVLVGTVLAIVGWRHLWPHRNEVATQGIYRYIRHPQYSGFIIFIFGSMLNWPTIITFLSAPLLIIVYYRLALQEEKENLEKFGNNYATYMKQSGRFFPKFSTK